MSFFPPELVVVAAVILLALGLFRRRAANARALFSRVAAGLGGRLDPEVPTWWSQFAVPTLLVPLRIGPGYARIQYLKGSGKNAPMYTVFTAYSERPASWSLHVRDQNCLDAIGSLLGLQDIRVGIAEFDELFVIKASDERRAASALAHPEVQDWLRALRRINGREQLELTLEHGAFRVRSRDEIDDEQRLAEFATLANRLHARISGTA